MYTNVEGVKETKVKNKDTEIGGFIQVTNKGAFVARARVIYILGTKVIEKQSPDIPVLQSAFFAIPDNATKVTFNVDVALFFGTWATIYWGTFEDVPSICYELYGTTFFARCLEVPCGSNDNNPNPVPPVIIPPYNYCCPYRYCCNHCCNSEVNNPYSYYYNYF